MSLRSPHSRRLRRRHRQPTPRVVRRGLPELERDARLRAGLYQDLLRGRIPERLDRLPPLLLREANRILLDPGPDFQHLLRLGWIFADSIIVVRAIDDC